MEDKYVLFLTVTVKPSTVSYISLRCSIAVHRTTAEFSDTLLILTFTGAGITSKNNSCVVLKKIERLRRY